MIRTKKKSSPVNVIDSAWESFFTEKREEIVDREQLAKDGWKTVREIAQRTGLPEPTIQNMVRREKFETMLAKVPHNGVRRTTLFVRPLIKP
jgi:hypothetical protein